MYFDTYTVTAFFVCFSAVEIFILEGEYIFFDYPANQGFYSTSDAGKEKNII